MSARIRGLSGCPPPLPITASPGKAVCATPPAFGGTRDGGSRVVADTRWTAVPTVVGGGLASLLANGVIAGLAGVLLAWSRQNDNERHSEKLIVSRGPRPESIGVSYARMRGSHGPLWSLGTVIW